MGSPNSRQIDRLTGIAIPGLHVLHWMNTVYATSRMLPVCAPATHGNRDARVDFFRGLALLFIFIDHIPGNSLAWLTLHNFGFADAGEIFVALAGYAAFLAYARTFEDEGAAAGCIRGRSGREPAGRVAAWRSPEPCG